MDKISRRIIEKENINNEDKKKTIEKAKRELFRKEMSSFLLICIRNKKEHTMTSLIRIEDIPFLIKGLTLGADSLSACINLAIENKKGDE